MGRGNIGLPLRKKVYEQNIENRGKVSYQVTKSKKLNHINRMKKHLAYSCSGTRITLLRKWCIKPCVKPILTYHLYITSMSLTRAGLYACRGLIRTPQRGWSGTLHEPLGLTPQLSPDVAAYLYIPRCKTEALLFQIHRMPAYIIYLNQFMNLDFIRYIISFRLSCVL